MIRLTRSDPSRNIPCWLAGRPLRKPVNLAALGNGNDLALFEWLDPNSRFASISAACF
jgi:hypothetical protein